MTEPEQPEAALTAAVSRLSTEAILDRLRQTANRRKLPSIAEIVRTRGLLAELETRCPDAFAAVANLDPGGRGYLRALVAAAGGTDARKPRRQLAQDDAALCAADPRCRKIELDGTGLSGTLCGYKVGRRRPLLPGYPRAGTTIVREICGKPARWSIPSGEDDLHKPDRLGYCTKHTAAVLRSSAARESEVTNLDTLGGSSHDVRGG